MKKNYSEEILESLKQMKIGKEEEIKNMNNKIGNLMAERAFLNRMLNDKRDILGECAMLKKYADLGDECYKIFKEIVARDESQSKLLNIEIEILDELIEEYSKENK